MFGMLVGLVESAIDRVLDIDPDFRAELSRLEGKIICLDLTGVKKKLYVHIANQSISLTAGDALDADVTIQGSPLAMIKLARTGDVQGMMTRNEVDIQGSLNTAQQLSDVLKQAPLDWEEITARLTNDRIATEASRFIMKGRDYLQGFILTSKGKVQEQTTERYATTQIDYDQHTQAIYETRLAVDRLAARVDRLSRQAAKPDTESDTE